MAEASSRGGFLGRIIDAAASPSQGLSWAWLTMLASCFGRAFLEGAFESSRQIGFALEPMQSQLMVFLHLPAFFLALFLMIILAVSAASSAPVERVTRLVAAGSPVIMLPVLVDHFIFGTGYQLYYLGRPDQITVFLLHTFLPWKELPGASPGIRIEVALGCLAAAAFCWHQTRSLVRAVAGFAAVFLCCILAGSLPILIAMSWSALSGSEAAMASAFGPGGLVQTDTRKYALVFLLLGAGLGAVWLRACRPAAFRGLLRASRPLRTLHYAGMVGLGFLAGWLTVGRSFPAVFTNPFDLLFPAAAALAIAFAFQSAVLLNDHFDRDIDRVTGKPNPAADGSMEGPELLRWSAAYAAASLALASALGQPQALIVCFTLAVSAVYSAPPLRLRRYYPLSVLLVALAALASCWMGFSAFGGAGTLHLFPPRLSWFIMVCFGLSFATKDMNDAEGDRRAGIITLPSLLGPKAGRRAVAALVAVAYAAGPLILGAPLLLAVAVPAGAATAWLVLRPRVREGLVFLVYFVFGALLAAALWLDPRPLKPGADHQKQGAAMQGMEHFLARRYAQAAPLLETAAGRDPRLLWPLARSLYGAGFMRSAGEAAARLMDADPLSEKGLYLTGRIALSEGKPDSAEAVYRRALDLGLAAFSEHLGDLLMERGRAKEAESSYRDRMASVGEGAALLTKLSRARLAQGDTSMALRLADAALGREPGYWRANALSGELALALGRPREAAARLEKAVRAMPGHAGLRERLATARLEAGDPEGAEADYRAAIAIDRGHGPAWSGLARLYMMTGRQREAVEAMDDLSGCGESQDEFGDEAGPASIPGGE